MDILNFSTKSNAELNCAMNSGLNTDWFFAPPCIRINTTSPTIDTVIEPNECDDAIIH